MKKILSVIIVGLLCASMIPLPSAHATPDIPGGGSVFPQSPPKIDGVVGEKEWDDAFRIPMEVGLILVYNDAINLYVLIDVVADTQNDPPLVGSPWGDYFWLSFDVDLNEEITPWVDVQYTFVPGTYNLGKAYYLGPGATTSLFSTYSQLGAGFGPSLKSKVPHRIWELAISLSEIETYPNGLVRMGLRVYSQNPAFTYDLGPNFHNDFSNLMPIPLVTAQVDLLVLACEDFLDALKPLKAHKDYTGISTYIQSWQSVNKSLEGEGRDEPERIKKAIAAYETYCDTRWVMLVGDSNRFPVRYTMTDRGDPKAFNRAFYPADLYYADLYEPDGSFDDWDSNENGYFGELHGETIVGVLNVDQVDLNPDVAVGRVPASTVNEVTTYVNKVISYEFAAYKSDWFKRALLIATTDWVFDFCKDKETIATNYLSSFTVYKLYSADNPCGIITPPPSDANINSRLNSGVGFANYLGHGDPNGWAVPGWYGIGDLDGLTNTNMLPIIFSGGCFTGQFATLPPYAPYTDIYGNHHIGTTACETFTHVPEPPAGIQAVDNPFCFGEDILVRRYTGAVGYVGCVTGSQFWCRYLDIYFFESLNYIWPQPTLGQMWNYMVRRYYQVHTFPNIIDPVNWELVAGFHQPWKFFLFGDPSLRVGGVSGIQKQDFLGTYDMNHDDWKGILELRAGPEDYIEQIPNIEGTYTASWDGKIHKVYGYVRTWTYPLPEIWGLDHRIEFYIDFYDTPQKEDDQPFEGYLHTGLRNTITGRTAWGELPFGFYAIKRDRSDFSTFFVYNQVRLIYASQTGPKPLGRYPATVSDWLASAFVSTKLKSFTEGLDTDGNFVDQTTGRPLGDPGVGIVSFGGPVVNVPVYYYEVNKIAPVIYCGVPGARGPGQPWSQWYLANGMAITEAAMGTDEHNDLFLIEMFNDCNDRHIFNAYGIDWRGTYAAGKFFESVYLPNLAIFTKSWIIVKWEDTNDDGFVNGPYDGDTYVILASGN